MQGTSHQVRIEVHNWWNLDAGPAICGALCHCLSCGGVDRKISR